MPLLDALKTLLRPPAPAAAPEAPPPDTGGPAVFAIGDVHGCADLLAGLLDRIAAAAQDLPDRERWLVLLGDYIDRGPDSRGVIDLILQGPPPGFAGLVALAGNHEEAMLDFLDDPEAGAAWCAYGGLATMASYGVPVRALPTTAQERRILRDELAAAVPESHRAFLADLPASHQIGDYFFVHAGVRPGLPLQHQMRQDLLWIREEFLLRDFDPGAFVVHGHTPVDAIDRRGRRMNLDTGAYSSGLLSGVLLCDHEQVPMEWRFGHS